jgi:trans-aconitate methyltransferase
MGEQSSKAGHDSRNTWDAKLYDDRIHYVSQLGKGVVELLQPRSGEYILDVGCGTGDLANDLASVGAVPTGIDAAQEMIQTAKSKYPNLSFAVEDARHYRTAATFDAVFSNAALHWIKQPASVLETIWHALHTGGRFVAEFGGKGNVAAIIQGVADGVTEYGVSAAERNPWYFPSIAEYTGLLEEHDLEPVFARLYDRPTLLYRGEDGLAGWLTMFGDPFFGGVSESDRRSIVGAVVERLRPALFRDGEWNADYRRLQIVAYREHASH